MIYRTLNRPGALGAVLLAGALGACNGDTCPVVTTWMAPDFDANTSEAIALREQIATLVGTMRDAEEAGTETTASSLETLYDGAGLSAAANPGFDPIAKDTFTEFEQLSAVGPVDLVDDTGAWAPGDHGGILGTSSRGINEGGIEVRQITDKGLFAGGALYRYAAQQTAGDVDPAAVESIAAAFGTSASLGADELDDSAGYANDMGFYGEVTAALTEAHGHAEDEACAADRDAALVRAFRAWELAMFARFIYYANEAQAVVAAEVSNESVATASHELSEGLGLAIGFYGLDAPASGPLAGSVRLVSDAQIERMMTALGVNIGDLGASTTGELLVDPDAFAAGVAEAEAAVAEAFGLTADEVAAFRVESGG